MTETIKIILFILAIAVSLYGYVYYGRQIPTRKLKPRTFTWLIWGILSTCAAIVQLHHGAGLGAVGAILGAGSGYVLAAMAWRYGNRRIHEADIISLSLAIAALVAWVLLGDVVAIIAAAFVYLVGFIPTVVRAIKAPYNERMLPFAASVFKYGVSLAILGSFSVETVTYPAALMVANILFILLLFVKRRK